jgi:hypothetical protein
MREAVGIQGSRQRAILQPTPVRAVSIAKAPFVAFANVVCTTHVRKNKENRLSFGTTPTGLTLPSRRPHYQHWANTTLTDNLREDACSG